MMSAAPDEFDAALAKIAEIRRRKKAGNEEQKAALWQAYKREVAAAELALGEAKAAAKNAYEAAMEGIRVRYAARKAALNPVSELAQARREFQAIRDRLAEEFARSNGSR